MAGKIDGQYWDSMNKNYLLQLGTHVRAVWIPSQRRMKYYWGIQELNYIGSSYVDDDGVFIKSNTLERFCLRFGI